MNWRYLEGTVRLNHRHQPQPAQRPLASPHPARLSPTTHTANGTEPGCSTETAPRRGAGSSTSTAGLRVGASPGPAATARAAGPQSRALPPPQRSPASPPPARACRGAPGIPAAPHPALVTRPQRRQGPAAGVAEAAAARPARSRRGPAGTRQRPGPGARMRSARAPDPNGHQPPRSPQRAGRAGLTEAQGLEVALGVGERCTVTRAIERRGAAAVAAAAAGPPVRPAGASLHGERRWRRGAGAEVAGAGRRGQQLRTRPRPLAD